MNRDQTTDVVLATFTNSENAERAINELNDAGYDPKQVSIIMKDVDKAQDLAESTGADAGTRAGAGAAAGAGTGAVAGGIAGLIIGISAIAVPGVGPLIVGGPIAAALGLTGAAATTATGAVAGAISGGILGALIGLGVPKEKARMYEERVNRGEILLAVPADPTRTLAAEQILARNNGFEITTITPEPTAEYASRDPWRTPLTP